MKHTQLAVFRWRAKDKCRRACKPGLDCGCRLYAQQWLLDQARIERMVAAIKAREASQ
jgi:hypothetical protein